jgi:undecaprenyl-diphosphatase
MFVQAIVSAILARFVIVEFIRWLWQRPRPFLENNINLLLTSDKPAFPSGHAAFYFAISTIVYLYNKKLGILFYAGTILICISRIFVGIHSPSDILAGAGIGLLVGCLIYKIFNKSRS